MKNLQNIIKGILSVAVFFMTVHSGVSQESKTFISVANGQTELMEKKEPMSKKNFRNAMVAPVEFTIEQGSTVTLPENWAQSDLQHCDGGNDLCGITFDESMYPLDAQGKPNSFVLNEVNSNWSSTPDGQEIGSTGIYVHRRI